MGGGNRVGAAWSASRMVTYEPAHGAETCPLSASTKPFSPLPKKCPGESFSSWLDPGRRERRERGATRDAGLSALRVELLWVGPERLFDTEDGIFFDSPWC
jgi:hypothetical protein